MSSKVEAVFTTTAQECELDESDFLVIKSLGINTAEKLFYRMPTLTDYEEFVQEKILPSSAFEDATGITVYPRSAPLIWNEFKRSEDMASLRRFYEKCKAMSKRDLDSESEAKDASTLKSLTPPVVADLIRKAPGLPAMTARDRPGNLCLSKVMANFQSGTGSFSHLQWECYTSSEEEKLAERRGERKVTNWTLRSRIAPSSPSRASLRSRSSGSRTLFVWVMFCIFVLWHMLSLECATLQCTTTTMPSC